MASRARRNIAAASLAWLLCAGCRREGAQDPTPKSEAPRPTIAPVMDEAPSVVAPVAKVESSDLWLDLLAQRPSAVILRDGALSVDLGRPHAHKHVTLSVRGQWALARSVEGRMAGIVLGRTASLDLPVDGALSPKLHPDGPEGPGLALALELHALQTDQSVTVLWNERPLANLQLGGGWERRTLSLPAEFLQTGENRLRLHSQ